MAPPNFKQRHKSAPLNCDPLGPVLMFSGPLCSTETVLVQALNGPNVNANSY